MPAFRLGDEPVAISRYDVVGQDSETVPHFVRHVGLCGLQQHSVRKDDSAPVVHMGPPLAQTDEAIQSIGTAQLTVDEINEISVFVDERRSEYEASRRRSPMRQYVVHPHAVDVRSNDGTVICTRFSCAGFVIEAYNAIDILLVSVDSASLPTVDIETLVTAYPDLENRLRNSTRRRDVGLDGDGPWPVILVGYLFNSLRRSFEEIRTEAYAPQRGDEYFPATSDGN